MLETVESGKGYPAPYLPFKTFLSCFEVFDHGIPRKIDRSMWRTQSGVLQGQIVGALHFFSLIDEEDTPRPSLERLLAKADQRKEHIGVLIQHAYREIFEHDITRMTPKILSDLLENFGVSGETKRKAAAFFLQAVRYADLPMHPLLTAQTRTSNAGGRKRKRPTPPPKEHNGGQPPEEVEPTEANTKSIKLASGALVTLRISANWLELPVEERTFVFGLIDLLQSKSAPVAGKSGKAQEEPR